MCKKSMTNPLLLVIAVMMILLITSCTFQEVDFEEQDLSFLLAVNKGLTMVATNIAVDADITTDRSSRTINLSDNDYESDSDTYDVLGTMTPAEVYDEYLNSQTGYAEVPDKESDNNRKYIEYFYDDEALEGYFRLKENVTYPDYYTVELYIYDRSNLYLDYEYEEYLVGKDDATWAYLSAPATSGLIKLETHNYDGSVVERDIIESGGAGNVYDIAVPAITSANYTFDYADDWVSAPDPKLAAADISPSRDLAGDYYVKTYGTGSGFEVISYYAETNDKDNRNAVTYILQPEDGNGNYVSTVTRSASVYDADGLSSRTIKSLQATTWGNSDPDTLDTQEITIEPQDTDDKLLHYYQVDKTYSGSLDTEPTYYTIMDIEEQNEKKYSGTYQVLWPDVIDNYTVKYEAGEFTMKQKKSTKRSIYDELTVNLQSLEGDGAITIALPGGGWFDGTFVGGVMSGSYTSGAGVEQAIIVRSGYILLGEDRTVWYY